MVAAFRVFLAGHLVLQSLALAWERPSTWPLLVTMGLGALLLLAQDEGRAGLWVLGLGKLGHCFGSFPFTPNHVYLECLLLAGLLLAPVERCSSQFVGLVNTAMVSLYFYSGVQKLGHGMWHQGEYLGLVWALPVTGPLSHLLRLALGQPPPLPGGFESWPFHCSRATLLLLLLLSWSVLVVEMVGGLCLALEHRLRGHALRWLPGFALLLGPVTGEWSFMFVNLACLALLQPEGEPFWFKALLAGNAIYIVLRLVGG